MFCCKKSLFAGVLLISMTFFPSINGIWPFNTDELSKVKELPEVNVPGYKGGKVTFTRIGKELFIAFLNQKNYDRTQINKIIKENEQSKLYHLYSAYCYGFDEWKKTKDPYQKEKIKRAVWNIAIEFAQHNMQAAKSVFLRATPHLIWSVIVAVVYFYLK